MAAEATRLAHFSEGAKSNVRATNNHAWNIQKWLEHVARCASRLSGVVFQQLNFQKRNEYVCFSILASGASPHTPRALFQRRNFQKCSDTEVL
jgi:hypothetical protein